MRAPAAPAGAAASLLLLALLLCGSAAALEQGSGAEAVITAGDDAQGAAAAASGGAAAGQQLAAAAAEGAGEGQQDDSVRCRLSGICEGASPDCGTAAGAARDPLACLTSDADRAAAVQAAARHAWSGYRCGASRRPACSCNNHPPGALHQCEPPWHSLPGHGAAGTARGGRTSWRRWRAPGPTGSTCR